MIFMFDKLLSQIKTYHILCFYVWLHVQYSLLDDEHEMYETYRRQEEMS